MKNLFKSVSVVGLGYIGLPTAAVLAGRGVTVLGTDINPAVVRTLNEGRIHITEPELDILVHAVVQTGHFRAFASPQPADAFLIAVPTPFQDRHKPDLSYVEAATRAIAPVLEQGSLVVLESTSPVGTTESVCRWLAEDRPDLSFPHQAGEAADVSVAYCPERVLPGRVLHELVENDRVIGGMTRRCTKRAIDLYRIFVEGRCLPTDCRTAELVKLTENAFRDVNIAFANELSIICDKLGINVWELISLANHHPRVKILQPGPGVGGHCIAVDPWFIVDSAPTEARIIRTAREVNDAKPGLIVEKVKVAAHAFSSPRVACLGLAFKADIDDLRESPSMHIVEELAAQGIGQLLVVEPHIERLPPSLTGRTEVVMTTAEDAIRAADIVLLLVNHRAFMDLNPASLEGKVVIDTRGIWQGRVHA